MVSLNQELKDQLKVIKTKSVEKILSPLIDEVILFLIKKIYKYIY